LLRGRAYRWIAGRHVMNMESFLNSVLLGLKGGLPRPGEAAVDSEVEKWQDNLFNETGLSEVEDCICMPDTPIDACERCSEQEVDFQLTRVLMDYLITIPKVTRSEFLFVPHLPSSSSNYINSRSKGGGVGTFLNDPALDEYFKENPIDFKMPIEPASSMIELPFSEGNQFREIIKAKISIESFPIRMHYSHTLVYAIHKAEYEDRVVVPVGLNEALKVRIITKMPPYLTFVMNAMMAPLRSRLKKDKRFCLTGEEIDEKILDSVFQNVRPIKSGDYKGASDNLKSRYSLLCADLLCDTVFSEIVEEFPVLRELLQRSLVGFQIYKTKDGEESPHRSNQFRGQLMGSVSSFPVLCLLNFALCKYSMELNPPEWRENLIINGDDCAFECSKPCEARWERTGRIMGLEPSMGKCDYSMVRVQMNSRSFRPDRVPERYCHGFLNERMEWEPYPELRWSADVSRRLDERSGHAHDGAIIDGQAICRRGCGARRQRMRPDSWRLRFHQGLSCRKILSRR